MLEFIETGEIGDQDPAFSSPIEGQGDSFPTKVTRIIE